MAFLAAIPAAIGSFVGNIGIGGLLQAGGAVISGISAMQAANYQAEVAKNNAVIAEENAHRSMEQAQLQQVQSDNEIAQFLGQQEAAQSASGLSVEGRSQVLTRRRTRQIGRTDALNIIEGGRTQARGFQQESANFRGEAAAQKAAGRSALFSGILGAGASLVGGASPTRSITANRMRSNRIPLPNGAYTTWRP